MVVITKGNIFLSIAPEQQERGPLLSFAFESNCQTPKQTVEIRKKSVKYKTQNPKTKPNQKAFSYCFVQPNETIFKGESPIQF